MIILTSLLCICWGGHVADNADLDKASPLRASATVAAAIEPDIRALGSGNPEMRNLQKLTLFSTSHPITSGEEEEDDKRVWEEDRVFDRISDGLLSFLQPERVRLVSPCPCGLHAGLS